MPYFEKLRQQISAKITERANEVIPNAVGDRWRNENFTVLFPGKGLNFLQPCNYIDNDWFGLANLDGDCVVRILTDENSPVDPTPLIASLFLQPIFVDPDPVNYGTGDVAFSMAWKATNIQDLISQPVITVISGEISNGYMLQRKDVDIPIYAQEPGSKIIINGL
jgi:hypothetical protein